MTTINRIEVPIPYAVRWINCYYIRDSTPTLIDTGHNTDEDIDAIREGVELAGGSLKSIRRIIVTHGHTDHIGLAGRIADETGASVHVHKWDRLLLADDYDSDRALREHAFRNFFTRTGTPQDVTESQIESILTRWGILVSPITEELTFTGGEVFQFDDFELRVVHTPGHSPGSVCLFDEETGALFCGDSLIQETICNPAAERIFPDLGDGYNGLTIHRKTLESVAALNVTTAYPGHGHPFTKVSKRLGFIGVQHDKRRAKLISHMEEYAAQNDGNQGQTVFELVGKLFPNFTEFAGFVFLSGVRAHLKALVEEGIVECRRDAVAEYYLLVSRPD